MRNRYRYCSLVLLAAVTAPNDLTAQENGIGNESEADGPEVIGDEETQWFFSGYASEEYRLRYASDIALSERFDAESEGSDFRAGSEMDNDIRLFLSGTLFESSDRFTADAAMGFWFDVDGTPRDGEPTSFGAIEDYRPERPWHSLHDVYSLYGEYRAETVPLTLRGGRQTSEHGQTKTFDGATVGLGLFRPVVELFVWGGRSVYFFDLDDDVFEDWLASFVTVFRPLDSLRLELDYLFTAEDTADEDRFIGHDYGCTAWYRFDETAQLKAHLRGLNDDISEAGVRAKLVWHEIGLGLEGGADAQLTTLREVDELNDPYFAILGESLPFIRLDAVLWKEFDTAVGLYGGRLGWNERLLLKDEPTAFNRNFGRTFGELYGFDIMTDGPFASLIVEYHYTHSTAVENEESLFAVGGSGGYEWQSWRAIVGSSYHRYKYDYYFDVREREDVRSYFAELKYDILDWLSARARYELEVFDRTLHTVTVMLSQVY